MACGTALALAVAVAVAVARRPAAGVALLARVTDVRQERQLSSALDRAGDLVLMAPAGAGDPARAALPAVGDELAQGVDVLVVDELDLVAAVLAGLAPAATAAGLAIPAACRPAALLRHCAWNPPKLPSFEARQGSGPPLFGRRLRL